MPVIDQVYRGPRGLYKGSFYRLIFSNLTTLIQKMQIEIPPSRKTFIISKKLAHLSEKMMTLPSSN